MKSSKDTEIMNNTEQKNGKGKLNYFLIFLICWLVVVTGFIAWFLLRFNDFAAKYEEQYQAAKDFLHQNPEAEFTLDDSICQKKYGAVIFKPVQAYKMYRKIVKYFATRSLACSAS